MDTPKSTSGSNKAPPEVSYSHEDNTAMQVADILNEIGEENSMFHLPEPHSKGSSREYKLCWDSRLTYDMHESIQQPAKGDIATTEGLLNEYDLTWESTGIVATPRTANQHMHSGIIIPSNIDPSILKDPIFVNDLFQFTINSDGTQQIYLILRGGGNSTSRFSRTNARPFRPLAPEEHESPDLIELTSKLNEASHALASSSTSGTNAANISLQLTQVLASKLLQSTTKEDDIRLLERLAAVQIQLLREQAAIAEQQNESRKRLVQFVIDQVSRLPPSEQNAQTVDSLVRAISSSDNFSGMSQPNSISVLTSALQRNENVSSTTFDATSPQQASQNVPSNAFNPATTITATPRPISAPIEENTSSVPTSPKSNYQEYKNLSTPSSLGQKMLKFVDWESGEIKYKETPTNATQLARVIAEQRAFESSSATEKKRAIRMIKIFMKEPTALDENLTELVALAPAGDKLISEKLITAIGSMMEKKTDKLDRLLDALQKVISNTLKDHFDQTLLAAVLDILVDRVGTIFLSDESSLEKILDSLVAILNSLYISGASGIPEERYKTYKDTFDDSWVEKKIESLGENTKDRSYARSIQAKKVIFHELLKNIGDSQNTLLKHLKIAGRVSLGLINLASSAISLDINGAVSSLLDVASAVGDIERKKTWFSFYQIFRVALSNSVDDATNAWNLYFTEKSGKINDTLAYLIADSIFNRFCLTPIGNEREKVFTFLNYVETHKKWTHNEEIDYFVQEKKTKMRNYKPDITQLSTNLFERAGRDERTIQDILSNIKEEVMRNQEFNSRFNTYIHGQAERIAEKGRTFDAQEYILNFISSSRHQVLLVLGDSGSGKSLLQQNVVRHLWSNYVDGKSPVPLYVPLTSLKKPRDNAIQEVLMSESKNTIYIPDSDFRRDQFKDLKNYPIVFFFDGFDEIEYINSSFYASNNLGDWPNCKFVIGCRKQFFDGKRQYQSLLAPNTSRGYSLDEIYLKPFEPRRRLDFFNKFASLHNIEGWGNGVKYEEELKKIKELEEWAVTPFMIFMAATTLPYICKERGDPSKSKHNAKMMKTDFLDTFSRTWFEREKEKLIFTQSSLSEDIPMDLYALLQRKCKKIAKAMCDTGHLALEYEYLEGEESKNPEYDEFFNPNPKHTLKDGTKRSYSVFVLRCAPIKKSSATTYEFFHKSLYEFFAAEYIKDDICDPTMELEGTSQLTPVSINTTAIFDSPTYSPVGIDTYQPLIRSRVSKPNALDRKLEPAILLNISEKVIRNETYQRNLFQVIDQSKTDASKAQAASNAITILNYADISFSGINFKGVHIPNADMSRCVADSVDFTGANLEGVNFTNSMLGDCILNDANMNDVNFGRLPLFQGHKETVTCVCNIQGLNGEHLLASGSNDKTIIIWDVATGNQKKMLANHTGIIKTVCSVKGPNEEKCLASGSDDNTIIIWDITTGNQMRTLKGHKFCVNVVRSIQGPHGENWLASGGGDKIINIWDIATGAKIMDLRGHTNWVNSVCDVQGPNGENWIASGSSDKTVRIWDLSTGSQIKILEGHTSWVNGVCTIQGPNGENWLASGGSDNFIRIWDIETGSQIKILEGHTNYVKGICSVQGPEGECWLASGSDDRTIRIWDIITENQIKMLEGHTGCVTSICNIEGLNGENWLASGSEDKTICIRLTSANQLKKPQGHSSVVRSVCSIKGPNGEKWLASGSYDKTIRIWDMASGNQIKILEGHSNTVWGLCGIRGPNGENWLASASWDKTIGIWDVITGSQVNVLEGNLGGVNCVCSIQGLDGRIWLVSGGQDKLIRIWDMVAGNQIKNMQGHSDAIRSICSIQGPNGESWLASGGNDRIIRIWDFVSGNQVKTLEGHVNYINCVCSIQGPNGENWLASGGNDNSIRLWDIAAGNQIKKLDGHTSSVWGVCNIQGPNGEKWLASGSWDKTISIWELSTGNQLHSFQKSEVTYTKGNGLVKKESPDDTIAIFKNVGDVMNLIDTNTISDGKTINVIGPRKLEGGNIQMRNVEGLSPFNKKILLSVGAVSFDEDFVKYCEGGKYTNFQAHMMAECYENGWGVMVNHDRFSFWRDIAPLKVSMNFEKLKQLAQEGSKDAFTVLQELAESSKRAAFITGECYENGWSVEKDLSKAVEWFGKAENFVKLKQLAQMIPSTRAFEELKKLAEMKETLNPWNKKDKHPQAISIVAECYENGWGVEKDLSKAVEWYGKAENTTKLNQIAQVALKETFQALHHVAGMKDPIYKLGKFAGERPRYPHVALVLASCYENGWGIKADAGKAAEWKKKATPS